ncbi:hypothetical protein [Curtobacterium sp. 18060]|uniref:hypothetical protein n=1 Tax=Curtobacterium sp. 18060 TaxID=2681408 RepID=UPI00135A7A2A|nr:hypothetical protein [Curtobacterium sp. 18060]
MGIESNDQACCGELLGGYVGTELTATRSGSSSSPAGSGPCLQRRHREVRDGGNIEAYAVATVEVAEAYGVHGHKTLALEGREEASVAAVRVAKVGVRHFEGVATDDALEADVLALARVVEDNDGRGSGGHAGSMRGRSERCVLCPSQAVVAELRAVVRDLHHVAAEAGESHDGCEYD